MHGVVERDGELRLSNCLPVALVESWILFEVSFGLFSLRVAKVIFKLIHWVRLKILFC